MKHQNDPETNTNAAFWQGPVDPTTEGEIWAKPCHSAVHSQVGKGMENEIRKKVGLFISFYEFKTLQS